MKRILAVLTFLLLSAPLFAQQTDILSSNPFDGGFGNDSGFSFGSDAGFGSQNSQATVSVTGKFIQDSNSPGTGKLLLEAVVPAGFHMYSITQKDGGPTAARITIESSSQYKVGNFSAQTPPQIQNVEYYDVPIEEHRGTVVWTAPIQFASGVDPSAIEIKGSLFYQICDDVNCFEPTRTSFTAEFAGAAGIQVDSAPFSSSSFQDSHSPISDAVATSEVESSSEEAKSSFDQNTSDTVSEAAAKATASDLSSQNSNKKMVVYILLTLLIGAIALLLGKSYILRS